MTSIAPDRALRLILVIIAMAAFLAPAPAAAQENQENAEDVLVRVNGTIDLTAEESVDVLVAVNSETDIAGEVRDTLVVLSGPATLAGEVGGEVVVVNGAIDLEPSARIGGDLTLIDSEYQGDGAVVAGGIVEREGAEVAAELSRAAEAISFVAWVGMTILFVVVALAWAAVGGRQLSAVAGLLAARPELAVGWGLVFWVAAPILAVAVMVTVIGLPLGIALLAVVLPLLWSLGYVVTGTRLGFFLDDLRGAAPDLARPYQEAVVGVGILQLVGLVPVVGGFVVLLAGLLGAGAIVVHAWRRVRMASTAGGQPLLDARA